MSIIVVSIIISFGITVIIDNIRIKKLKERVDALEEKITDTDAEIINEIDPEAVRKIISTVKLDKKMGRKMW